MDEKLIKLLLPVLNAESCTKTQQKSFANEDEALILPLVVLFMAEKKDMMLILALMSILL